MTWTELLLAFFGLLILLMALRVPVAFAMMAINFAAAAWLFGIEAGTRQLVLNIEGSLASFNLVPVVMFILMGEILFRSGIITQAIAVIDACFGRVRGRLPMLATASGAILSLLSGSTLATTAVLGSSMLPDMERTGYSTKLSMGSIMAAGGLAMIIPPSTLTIIWGVTANVPIGPLFVACIIPGILLALAYIVTISIWSHAGGAPPAAVSESGLPGDQRLLVSIVKFVLPLVVVITAVLGTIFMGVATPSESAALGVIASAVLAVTVGRSRMGVFSASLGDAARVTGMVFMVLASTGLYGQLMGFSGATSGASLWVAGLEVAGSVLLLAMMVLVVVLGFFVDEIATMLITIPFFMPIVLAQGWDPLWFGTIMLVALNLGVMSPPFGLALFIMKGIRPDVPTLTIYAATVPFMMADIAIILLIAAVPSLALYLPQLMA